MDGKITDGVWEGAKDNDIVCRACGEYPIGIKELESMLPIHTTALNLWREWFAEDASPGYASRQGDIHCFFCGAWLDHEEHTENCIYIRAKGLVSAD